MMDLAIYGIWIKMNKLIKYGLDIVKS